MPNRKFTIRGEYDTRLADMVVQAATTATAMKAHIEADAMAFASILAQVTEVNKDVKSMIESRAIATGAWKAATAILGSGLVASLAALVWKLLVH